MPSRQEIIRRRRRTGFVGRRGEIAAFQDNFARDPQDDQYQFLFHIHGNAGVGKTTLVRQWEDVAREKGAAIASVGDEVHSALEVMESVSAQLRGQGLPFKDFDRLLATYRQRRQEAESSPALQSEANPGGTDSGGASLSSTLAVQAGLTGLGMLPGVGAFTGAVDPRQLAQRTDRLRASLSARFRSHDDVQLVLDPVRMLTPPFLEGLAQAGERRPWVALFFDTYERTAPVLDTWLRDILMTDRYGSLPLNTVAVAAGQGRLNARVWGDWLDLVAEIPLDVFTDEEARRLLATRGVTEDEVIDAILDLSGRLPVLVDMLAQKNPHEPTAVGDPSDTAVERFLKWESDPQRRAAALACALPLRLDEDVYRVAVGEGDSGGGTGEEYAWLQGLPFISGEAGRCRYHDVVRTQMLRLQRKQSPIRWREQHLRLADVFRSRRLAVERVLRRERACLWDAGWWEHHLNEVYHRLCADPREALPAALGQTVWSCIPGTAEMNRWSQLLVRVGGDAGADSLAMLGRQLESIADAEESTGVLTAVLTLLLARTELGTKGRALAHTVRAREHRKAKQYGRALADCGTALELDPGLGRAWAGSGEIYRLVGRYEEALTNFTRAIEIDPDDSWAFAIRGRIYGELERREEALADLTCSLAIYPGYLWALVNRADIYRSTGRYEEAIADYSRAAQLDPSDGWYALELAVVCHMAGRSEEHAHWLRAQELFTEQTGGSPISAARARGNLLIAACAQSRWESTEVRLTELLASDPEEVRIRTVRQDLREIQQLLALDEGQVGRLCEVLETAEVEASARA
ncbi:tetratricopeptide repeat protein [Streptomyces sp. NBC_01387]|uniref:tetratricopeptide repeat protein n=1 Tax=Streptomyces sp. NBC_01387 TaxID=2903849 RepID=UPI003251842E